MNYKLGEIEELFEKIKNCIEYYEKEYIDNKIFTMYLANGERVKYSITPINIPHLLGINLTPIKNVMTFNSDNTLSLLKELCDRSYELYNKFNSGVIRQEDVFSNYIEKKIETFKDNVKPDLQYILKETEFVCCYKSKRSWEVTDKNQKYDYIIVKKYDDESYGLLCLVKKGSQCYAMSSQIAKNEIEKDEILSDLIKNQEVTILSGMNVHNAYTNTDYLKNLDSNRKILKLRNLKLYKQKFECNIDVSGEYEYAIGKVGNNKIERYENRTGIEDIVNSIVKGKLISTKNYDDSILIDIINAWNDHICKNNNNSNNEVSLTYSNAIKELNSFKELATSLTKENETLKIDLENEKEKNKSLEQDNDEQKQIIKTIYETIKPRI